MKKRILIVSAKYYEDIYTTLLTTTIDRLSEDKQCTYATLSVPGVFEIPYLISMNIEKYDACVALGCVIKGETPHFEFISQATTNAILQLSIDHKKPIGNGIITCLNKKQAVIRALKKGKEAASAALTLYDLAKLTK